MGSRSSGLNVQRVGGRKEAPKVGVVGDGAHQQKGRGSVFEGGPWECPPNEKISERGIPLSIRNVPPGSLPSFFSLLIAWATSVIFIMVGAFIVLTIESASIDHRVVISILEYAMELLAEFRGRVPHRLVSNPTSATPHEYVIVNKPIS